MTRGTEELEWDGNGLLPAIIQDEQTGEVLTLAYVNRESLERTMRSRQTWFWSRSRRMLWHKGETSGNTQRVTSIAADCDRDAVLIRVEPAGNACHTGSHSCFHNPVLEDAEATRHRFERGRMIERLAAVIAARRADRPAGSYTAHLFNQGLDKILKKLGEEAAETIIAAKNDDSERLIAESADMIYHLMVLLEEKGLRIGEVIDELGRRSREKT